MTRFIAAVRRFNLWMHYVAGIALVGMLALTVADITGRSAFNNPVAGTVELTTLILVVVVYLGLAHSEDLGDHITVDLLYVRVGDRAKRFLDFFADTLTMAVLGLMAFQLFRFSIRQQDSGAESPVLQWPVWPFVVVAGLGALGYSAATFLKLVLRIRGEPTEIVDQVTGGVGGLEGGGLEI